jgi:DASH complex subunit DAD3
MASNSNSNSQQIFSVNPYEDHPSLTQIEADVLWEYAKLNQHIKDVRNRKPSPPTFVLL